MSKEVEFKNRDRFIQLGLTIAALRKMQGMSQEQLAEKANISRSHLSSIEAPNIIRPFSLEVLYNIADALNANLNRGVTILYGEGGYLKQPKHVLYSVVTRLEIMRLKNTVYEVDPSAFITIQDVHDVFGGRFTKNGH